MIVWALVFTILSGLLMVGGTLWVYMYQRDPFIACRNPTLLIIQNIGIMISALISSIYIAIRPHFSCWLYYFGAFFIFSGFAYPISIRYWEYCVNFRVSQVRSKFRTQVTLQQWGEEDWFFRHRWLGSRRFLNKIYCFGFWIWLAPILPNFFLINQYDYNLETQGCTVYDGGYYMIGVLAVVFFACGAFLAYITRGSPDAYFIKHEMGVICIFWVIVIVILIPYQFAVHETAQRRFPASALPLLGLYVSFICSNFFPLYLAHRNKTLNLSSSHSDLADFERKLETILFRNAFLDFLATQFCQETILFYQAVVEWKKISDDVERIKTAHLIHDTFVVDGATCQVNIPGDIRDKLTARIERADITNDVFDEATHEVLDMVHSNSYVQFKRSALYKNTEVF
eukprot:Phypoly_transcript_08801.p1 GENE.Phypoly_transcript_08801~~Phypoly_transcript_08801.p1  ORF type:complete len:398 (+),score=30.50 Phypoly_transcript_08801:249-1442(+)